jgi:hypothetical protein
MPGWLLGRLLGWLLNRIPKSLHSRPHNWLPELINVLLGCD